MNRRAIEWTIKLGLALECEIAEHAVFARKNYFYPDLPKGYQISQYDLPSCINGKVLLPTAEGDRVIGIVRAHLEEDAAKTVHVGGRSGRIGGADSSLVDYNRGRNAAGRDRHRAGHPLRGRGEALPPAPAADHRRARHLRCGDGEGHAARRRQRLRPPGRLGRAAHAHRDQEHELLQLHRPWDRGGGRAADRRLGVGWRGGAADLRLRRRDGHSHCAALEGGGRRLPLLPGAGPRAGRASDASSWRLCVPSFPSRRRLGSAASSPHSTSSARPCSSRAVSTGSGTRRVAAGADRVAAANVIANNLVGAGVDPAAVPARRAREARRPRATRSRGRRSTRRCRSSASPDSRRSRTSRRRRCPTPTSSARSSTGSSTENPGQVAAYRGGKEGLLGFFVGQVMKETQGKANPRVVSDLVREKLAAA